MNREQLARQLNGAIPLGQPKPVGQVVIGLMDNGKTALLSSNFDPLVTQAILMKAALSQTVQLTLTPQLNVPQPPPDEAG